MPDSRVGTAKKGINVFGFAGFGVVHLACNRRVVLGRLNQVEMMGARVKSESGETHTWTFAKESKNWRKFIDRDDNFVDSWWWPEHMWRQQRNRGAGHPRKSYGEMWHCWWN